MPISFGSVGDIISICLIIKDLVAALDDSRGSASEYREVVRELWGLDRALLEVDLLSRTCENTTELNALCKTAQQAAKNCRHCIEEFTKKIEKYGPALRGGTSRNFLRDTTMKIRWVSQKEDIVKFRAQVTAHVHSLNMLLASASVNMLRVNDRKLNARLTERSNSQDALIIEVRDRLQENSRLISIGNTVTTRIADTLRLDWIRQLGSDLKRMMERIFNTNLATYKAVLSLQARLPSHLERSLEEEPFILEDAIGRIAPVHMRFISSWEAFDAVLELRFRSVQGHKKVKNGEYVIQERATRHEIRRNLPWEAAFLPGQRVDMSLIFENREEKISTQTICPRCQTASSELQDSDIQCSSCGMWYRRITEYNDVEPPPIPSMATPRKNASRFGQSEFRILTYGPAPAMPSTTPSSKRKMNEANLEETEDVAFFKRVRVISKHDRIKTVFTPFSLHATTSGETIINAKAKQDVEEQAARKLFETRAADLGMDHPDTHSSLNTLACCLRNQRKFAAAEDLFRAAYDARKDSLISEDPETLQVALMNLMTVLADQNKGSEIDELRQAATVMFKSNMESGAAEVIVQRLQVVQVHRTQAVRIGGKLNTDSGQHAWQEIPDQKGTQGEWETIVNTASRGSSPKGSVGPKVIHYDYTHQQFQGYQRRSTNCQPQAELTAEEDIPLGIQRKPKAQANWNPALQTLEGNSGRVISVGFSPDGKQVVSGSDDKIMRLWDAMTGAALQTLEGHSSSVTSVAFSPNSKQVVSGSDDKTMRLWDAATGAPLQTLEGHLGWVSSVAFSPNGKQVVSGSYDKMVRLWDAATGALLQTLEGHSSSVNSVAFSPNGKQVVSRSADKTVRLWDTATGALLQTLEGHSGWVSSVAFSPDGKQVVSGSEDKTVRLWDAATGALLQTLEGHSGWVSSVAFSPNGKQVVSGSYDKIVRLWDAATGALLQTLEGHSSSINSVAFSPNGKQVVSGSDDKTVRLWDAATSALLQTLEGHSGWVSSVAFLPNGKQVVSGSYDETVRLWDTITGAALQTLEGHSSLITSIAFSANGKQVVSGLHDETVRLWDTIT